MSEKEPILNDAIEITAETIEDKRLQRISEIAVPKVLESILKIRIWDNKDSDRYGERVDVQKELTAFLANLEPWKVVGGRLVVELQALKIKDGVVLGLCLSTYDEIGISRFEELDTDGNLVRSFIFNSSTRDLTLVSLNNSSLPVTSMLRGVQAGMR